MLCSGWVRSGRVGQYTRLYKRPDASALFAWPRNAGAHGQSWAGGLGEIVPKTVQLSPRLNLVTWNSAGVPVSSCERGEAKMAVGRGCESRGRGAAALAVLGREDKLLPLGGR